MNRKELNQVNFIHQNQWLTIIKGGWFLNDPKFIEMENSQYNYK